MLLRRVFRHWVSRWGSKVHAWDAFCASMLCNVTLLGMKASVVVGVVFVVVVVVLFVAVELVVVELDVEIVAAGDDVVVAGL